ncbi:MAG: biotin--[acetyl-CoA-carboxylase] ligase [Gemmatimonadota bacterium]|nr:MAG: biotin--[acetyl-CoA-carboxylase] ligase [Gemmatimonadota bacterium]
MSPYEQVVLPASELLSENEIQKGLRTSFVGRTIYAFRRVKSTSDFAFRVAEEGALEGTVVLAEEQTAGRGRFGRSWHSPPGVGIWCSVVLRPNMFPWEAPRITMVAALAVVRAVRNETGLCATLKWPNDVLIRGRKICGILTELSAEIESINFIIVGIGLNVNQRETQFPSTLRGRATSLRSECGREVSRIRLLRSLFSEFEETYGHLLGKGFSTLREEIRSHSTILHRTVSVRLKNRVYKGRAIDIDERGGLVLELSNGRIEHVLAGDVSVDKD